MNFEEIKKSDKLFLHPKDIAEVLKVHPYSISKQAKEDPSKLLFPVVRMGTETKIPRYAFIKFCTEVLGFC